MEHIKNILYTLYLGGGLTFVRKYILSLFSGRKIFKENLKIKTIFEDQIQELKKKKYLYWSK